MKFTIEKTAQVEIDTSHERKRIDSAFKSKKDKETREMLHKLMDAIEAGKWDEAQKQVDSKWWQGYDNAAGCPRVEFIGSPFHNPTQTPPSSFFSWDWSYLDMVNAFTSHPKNFKVVSPKAP